MIKVLISVILIIILYFIYKKNNMESNISTQKINILSWEESYKKAKEYLKTFSLKEKISLMYGNTINPTRGCVGQIFPIKTFFQLKFPGIKFDDGPQGVRFQKGKTISWPTTINLSSTFNKKLIYEIGKAQGYEFYKKGINVALTPNINILRIPNSGRIFESFGENPFLTGNLASNLIKGIQENGVIACAKHYIGNEQETYRNASNSIIDERTLWEIYLEPFYRVINDSNVGCIMCSYNAVNGIYLFKNKILLNDILKEKLNFKGFIISDWFAVYDNSPDSINAGLDINMPGCKNKIPFIGGSSYWDDIPKYINEGKISENRINDTAERIIATMFKMNQLNDFPKGNFSEDLVTEDKIKLNRKAAAESNILLKNDDNILPIKLDKNKKIKLVVLGINAFKGYFYGSEPNFIHFISPHIKIDGHLTNGYGSASTTYKYVITPIDGIQERIKNENVELISYAKLDNNDNENIENSVNLSKDGDIILIFVHSISGESYLKTDKSYGDRKDLELLHNGGKLIEEVSKVNKNIIVIINSPGPINLYWKDLVKGIIFGGLAGQESGNGITDILFGDVNPSGHLPFVMGKIEDYPTYIKELQNDMIMKEKRFEGSSDMEEYIYKEGLFIGQYWFDKNNITPYYPFGFGLSYTKFELNNLNLIMNEKGLEAKFNVKNIGNLYGGCVVLLYIHFPDCVEDFPMRVLRGFEKVFLNAQEEVECSIFVDNHSLSYYDINQKKFVKPNQGNYIIYIGQSAALNDLVLEKSISV